ncbi:putative armadillo-like helical, CLASP domain, TOG domain-containing protein [Plasmopara halstedii]
MRGDRSMDISLMYFGGKTNVVLELGRRLIQPEEEWKDKCEAFTELRKMLQDNTTLQKDVVDEKETAVADNVASHFTPENVQALTQPFRVTLTDLRSTIVREACTTLSLLARTLGPLRCKILVRDVFPTLLDARGGSNKVNTAAIHNCIISIVTATPSRFVLVPVLQVLHSSKNREMRESCIHYTRLALERWNIAVLERHKIPLQSAIAAALSDASPKGREMARDCYWNYISIWPNEVERMGTLLAEGVKKYLKRSRDKEDLHHQSSKRRHLATITNSIALNSGAKDNMTGDRAQNSNKAVKRTITRRKFRTGTTGATGTTETTGTTLRASRSSKMIPLVSGTTTLPVQVSLQGKVGATAQADFTPIRQIPSTLTPALIKAQEGDMPSKIPTPCASRLSAPEPITDRQHTTTHLGCNLDHLGESNTLLMSQMEAMAQQIVHLREQNQKLSCEHQQCNLKQKVTMTAKMDANATDTATQDINRHRLAEQLASQEKELKCLQNWRKSSIFQIQSPQTTFQSAKINSLLLIGQQQATTAVAKTPDAEANDEIRCSRSEKAAHKKCLTTHDFQRKNIQAEQSAKVAANEEEKRMLVVEYGGELEASAQCNEKDERLTQLETELTILSKQLQATATKPNDFDAGDEINSIRTENSVLKERLTAYEMQLEELQSKQYAEMADIKEEKRVLMIELSALKSSKMGVLAQCEEKNKRVAQLESELSLSSKQLQTTIAELEILTLKTVNMQEASQTEKSVFQERLSAQMLQLEELYAKQYDAATITEKEKCMLAKEVLNLKRSQLKTLNQCDENIERVARLESDNSSLSKQLQNATAELAATCFKKAKIEKHLSAQMMELEDLYTKQYDAASTIEEEKRMLAKELLNLKSSQLKALYQCEEKIDLVARLESDILSLSKQLQAATAELEASCIEKAIIEKRLSAQMMEQKDFQAEQYAVVAAIEEEKRMLAIEVSALKLSELEALARCKEKDEWLVQLEDKLLILSTRLQASETKLKESSFDTGDEINSARTEISALKERLAAYEMQLEERQAKQYAAMADIKEEKHLLMMEVSALKSSKMEVLAQCEEKNKRVAQLESELSSSSKQLQATMAELETLTLKAENKLRALRTERSVFEGRLSAQMLQLEDLYAKQYDAAATTEEERRMLAKEVSSLKISQLKALTQCEEKIERVARLESDNSSLSKQLQSATSKLEASCIEKAVIEKRLSAKMMELEELQAERCTAVAAVEEEKRMLAIEVSALKRCELEALAQCKKKDECLVQLENKLLILSTQLQASETKLKESRFDTGDEINSARTEISFLRERLAAYEMQLEELQAKQYAAMADIKEEKRLLMMEVSALKSSKMEVLAQCEEKNQHVAQLECKLSSSSKQLQTTIAELEILTSTTDNKLVALRTERSVSDERSTAQMLQLEDLYAKQYDAAAITEEERRMLAKEVLSLKSNQLKAFTQSEENEERVAQLESDNVSLSEQLHAAEAKLEASYVEKSAIKNCLSVQTMQLEDLQAKQYAAAVAVEEDKRVLAIKSSASTSESDFAARDDVRRNPTMSSIPLTLIRTRDRLKVEAEKRRINETNVINRKLRRQNRQRET